MAEAATEPRISIGPTCPNSADGSHKLQFGIPSEYLVLVAPSKLHRARFILSETDLTERELAYLATGNLEIDADSSS
jgi:hypothetical protein